MFEFFYQFIFDTLFYFFEQPFIPALVYTFVFFSVIFILFNLDRRV